MGLAAYPRRRQARSHGLPSHRPFRTYELARSRGIGGDAAKAQASPLFRRATKNVASFPLTYLLLINYNRNMGLDYAILNKGKLKRRVRNAGLGTSWRSSLRRWIRFAAGMSAQTNKQRRRAEFAVSEPRRIAVKALLLFSAPQNAGPVRTRRCHGSRAGNRGKLVDSATYPLISALIF